MRTSALWAVLLMACSSGTGGTGGGGGAGAGGASGGTAGAGGASGGAAGAGGTSGGTAGAGGASGGTAGAGGASGGTAGAGGGAAAGGVAGSGGGISPTALFVDSTLTAACNTYHAANRSCAGGSSRAFQTIAAAAAATVPGSVVAIRQGTYAEKLAPPNSGTAGQPITFMAYSGETPVISGALEPGVQLSGRSHVVVDGLTVRDVRRFLYALNSHHVVLRRNRFIHTTDTSGSAKTGVFFEDSHDNVVEGNNIEDTAQDNLTFIRSDRNLVQNNTLRRAAHVLWVIKCGNNNIVRGNDLHNELQKIGEIYDCDGVGFNHDITAFNATKRNLVEGNTFRFTPSSGNASPYAGMQYAGQQGIIRRNVFYGTVGPGLDLTRYSAEALNCTDNRVAHNVFYGTSFAGIALAGGNAGNQLKNNIVTQSAFVANDTRWAWYTQTLSGQPVQVMFGGLSGFRFERNDILGTAPGQLHVLTYGDRASTSNPPAQLLSWWQSNHAGLFTGNREVAPAFVDAAAKDFRLASGSPLIDDGAFLTATSAAGSGTQLQVEDALWFSDGLGVATEQGDLIRLEGDATTARVTAVNLATRTLTLDRALTWQAGQRVSWAFNGAAPDIGAFER